jgi:hypothetical protein
MGLFGPTSAVWPEKYKEISSLFFKHHTFRGRLGEFRSGNRGRALIFGVRLSKMRSSATDASAPCSSRSRRKTLRNGGLAKDFENLNRNALAFIELASIRLMVRKLSNSN